METKAKQTDVNNKRKICNPRVNCYSTSLYYHHYYYYHPPSRLPSLLLVNVLDPMQVAQFSISVVDVPRLLDP